PGTLGRGAERGAARAESRRHPEDGEQRDEPASPRNSDAPAADHLVSRTGLDPTDLIVRPRADAKRPPASGSPEITLCVQIIHEGGDALVHRLGLRVEHELGARRRLVGRRDPRELRYLPRARLLVQALHVAALAGLHTRLDVDLDEVALSH